MYHFLSGYTARVAGTTQAKIAGKDPLIFGGMQAANPAWYGGETVNLFGGIEVAGHEFGLGHTRLAIEAGEDSIGRGTAGLQVSGPGTMHKEGDT